jgi:hypothetical protein
VNFGTTKYEHSVLRKYFLKTAVSDRGSISLVFWCLISKAVFQRSFFKISEMPIELLGVGTDRRQGRFQLPTPSNSIGPSEVARDCFKAGCFRLPLVAVVGFLTEKERNSSVLDLFLDSTHQLVLGLRKLVATQPSLARHHALARLPVATGGPGGLRAGDHAGDLDLAAENFIYIKRTCLVHI